jgi:hypothetical protein
VHWVLCPSYRYFFLYTVFCVHQIDIVSCALSSVSIRQTFFPIHWVLCQSDRHCFLCTEFCVHQTHCFVCSEFCVRQTDTVSCALSSVSVRQTCFPIHWVLCPSDRHCFLCTEFCVHQTHCFVCPEVFVLQKDIASYAHDLI